MIGNKIPAANVPFKCFRNLLEICRLCFMDSFNSCDLVTLDWLIDDFLDSFKTCCCNKFRLAKNKLLNIEIKKSKVRSISLSSIKCAGRVAHMVSLDDISVLIDDMNWIVIGSTQFKIENCFVLCLLQGKISGTFGKITKIISVCDKIIFICEIYRCVSFNAHYQSYKICKMKDSDFHLAIKPFELLTFNVYAIHDLHVVTASRPANKFYYIASKTEISNFVLSSTK